MVAVGAPTGEIARALSHRAFGLFLARHNLASVQAFVAQVERRSKDWEDTGVMHEVLGELEEYVRDLTEAQE